MKVRALVGWNVRRLRVEQALSQEALGLLAGCEPSYIGRIERGRENTTIETLELLATTLRAPIAALFVEPEHGAEPPAPLRAGRRPKGSKPSG